MKASLYILIFACTLAILIGISHVFSVKEIHVEGATDIKGLERVSGRFIPSIQADKIVNQILQDNPSLTSVKVYVYYPHTLYVSARKVRPVLAIKLADGYALISEEGKVLSKYKSEDEPNVPVVTYYHPLFYNQFTIGEQVSQEELTNSASFLNGCAGEGIRVTKIDISNENMIVLHTDSFEILITSERDIDKQLATFVYTIRQLRQQGTEFKRIDVRFEKPVIKLI